MVVVYNMENMKIKDLIKELNEFDENLDVCAGIVINNSSEPWSTARITCVGYLDVDDEERGAYIEVLKPKNRDWDMR